MGGGSGHFPMIEKYENGKWIKQDSLKWYGRSSPNRDGLSKSFTDTSVYFIYLMNDQIDGEVIQYTSIFDKREEFAIYGNSYKKVHYETKG